MTTSRRSARSARSSCRLTGRLPRSSARLYKCRLKSHQMIQDLDCWNGFGFLFFRPREGFPLSVRSSARGRDPCGDGFV
jgi:hypothetical protein